MSRLFGVAPAPAGVHGYTREDILYTVREAEDTGVIEEAEEEMLYKVFDFAGKEVHEVMVPRPEVVAISVDLPPEECLAAVIDSPYTRYPAYKGSLDDIVGILHVRDLFSALNDRGIANVSIEELLRPAFVVPETKDLAALLADFRRAKVHMAIVVDEYGAMEGIVTLEDLLEEIVGEIEDEYDLPDEAVERIDDTTIRIGGTFPIDDFNEQFGTELPQEDYHTIAGFVFGLLGRAPEEGDEVAARRSRVPGARHRRLAHRAARGAVGLAGRRARRLGRGLAAQNARERGLTAAQHRFSVRDEHTLHRQLEQRLERLAQIVVRRLAEPALRAEPQSVARCARLGTRAEQHVADRERTLRRQPEDDLVHAGGRERLQAAG